MFDEEDMMIYLKFSFFYLKLNEWDMHVLAFVLSVFTGFVAC